MAGAGDTWGTEEELLHPRSRDGRFKSKGVSKVGQAILNLLRGLNFKEFADDNGSSEYLKQVARRRPGNLAALDRFVKGFSKVNQELRAGKTGGPDVKAIDSAMQPLPDDIIVTRVVSPVAFGLGPNNINDMVGYEGKLVADKGYSSANIGTPIPHPSPSIELRIAVPKGTKAAVPRAGGREILLNRDQPLHITKVQPDGRGGFYAMAVATDAVPGHENPIPLSPQATPGTAPQAQAPQTPGAPPPVTPTVDTGPITPKQGRPAGPGPAPRADGHVAENVGGEGPPQTPETPPQGPTPTAPAPEEPPLPDTPEPGPDNRTTFRDAFSKAKLNVPSQGPRRKDFNDAYLGVTSGKVSAADTVRTLDDRIALHKRVIASDKEDGTDSGPLPEDVNRLEQLSDLIKEEFNLPGRKERKEEPPKAAPAKAAPKAATPAKVAPAKPPMSVEEADRQIAAGERERKAASRRESRKRTPEQVKADEKRNREAEDKRRASARNAETERIAEVDALAESVGAKPPTNEMARAIVAIADLDAKRGRIGKAAIATRLREATSSKWAEKDVDLLNKMADSIEGKGRAPRKAAAPKEAPTDIDKMTVPQLKAEAGRQGKKVPSKLTRKADIAAFLKGEKEAPLSVAESKALATGNNGNTVVAGRRELDSLKERGLVEFRDAGKPSGRPSAFLTQKGWEAAGFKGDVPAPRKVEAAAPRTLTDKELLRQFEAGIKEDSPDEARLKALGDELDRRDLESANRVKALSDDDLEKQFTDAIRADAIDQELVDKLGAEMDRRDREAAAREAKIDALMAKGRDFRDAWAEVEGKDPKKLDLEERKALVDATRRPGESGDAALRRMFADHLQRQYLAAEKETRGHLLTPEGRSKGIDPKSLFLGSSVNANKWASDELKEFWEANPRKNFIQFKADTLGRDVDIAAAKKSEGIQRNVELGEALKRRSPQKKATPTPAPAPAVAKALDGSGVNYGDLNPDEKTLLDRLAPAMANQKDPATRADIIRPAEEDKTKQPNLWRIAESIHSLDRFKEKAEASKAAPEAPKTPATGKPLWGTMKTFGAKNGDIVMFHGRDRKGPSAEGQRVRVEGDRGGFTLFDAETGERVTSFGVAGRNWLGRIPKEGDTGEPKKPAEKGLINMTIPELREVAKNAELRVPPDIRKKDDIVNWLAEALPQKEAGLEPDQRSLRTRRRDLKASALELKRLQRERRMGEADRQREAERAARPQEVRDAEARGTAKGILPVIYGDRLQKRFDAMTSREQAMDLMVGMDPTRQELVDIAKSLNISHPRGATKNQIRDTVINWGVGRRLDAAAVSRPAVGLGADQKVGPKTPVPEVPAGPKMNPKPLEMNRWGVPGGEVNFHQDGNIGQALTALKGDVQIDVKGEPLGDVLGKWATRTVAGQMSQQDLIDNVRKLAANLPEGPRRILVRAAAKMDAPEMDRPELPKGTPAPIKNLLDKLMKIPLARSENFAGDGKNEIQKLDELMQKWADGGITPLRFESELQQKLFNGRHESSEGKFELDRAVQNAMNDIREMARGTGRARLRPPLHEPLPQRAPRELLNVKPDLSDASMPQLQSIAKAEGVKVPTSLRSKAEVAEFLNTQQKERTVLDALPDMARREQVAARMKALKDEIDVDPDAYIAAGFGGTPHEILEDLIENLETGKFDVRQVAVLLADLDNMVVRDSPLRSAIKKAHNDVQNIYIETKPASSGNPRHWHTQIGSGVEDLARDITQETLADPATKKEVIIGGVVGTSRKIILPNGREVFEKTSRRMGLRSGKISSDAEQLGAAVGRSMGAPVLPTMRMSDDTIYTDWINNPTIGGQVISDVFNKPNAGYEETWNRIKNSDEAQILGLLDLITFNGDRHSQNWLVNDRGDLVAIDNGMAWGWTDADFMKAGMTDRANIETDVFPMLIGRFTLENYFDADGLLKDNHLTLEDLETLTRRLEALREQFRHLNQEKWLDLSLKAIELLRPHAKGKRNLIK